MITEILIITLGKGGNAMIYRTRRYRNDLILQSQIFGGERRDEKGVKVMNDKALLYI